MKKFITLIMLAVVFSAFIGPTVVFAANWSQEDKIYAGDPDDHDAFGTSVSISGDYAVGGAPSNDGSGIDEGAAYVFSRSGSSWSQVAKLTASDAANYDEFGESVDIDGDFIVVGARNNDSSQGKAYVFKKPVSGWTDMTETAILTASDKLNDDNFGTAVGISGDYVVIGASGNDDAGSASGSAYIFKKPVGGWSDMTETKKITAGDAEGGDIFGVSAGIDGDYIIVGAGFEDEGGSNAGAAYIFFKDQGGVDNWGQQAKLIASDAADNDRFSYSIDGNGASISGDYALVGACFKGAGSAYIFYKDEGGTNNWGQQAKLTASDGVSGDYLGRSVSIYGNTAIAGADHKSSSTGAAYIFERGGGWSGTITEDQKITADDGDSNDEFGHSVAISGYYSLIGARADENGSYGNAGSGYIFHSSDDVPVPEYKDYVYILTILIAVGLMYKVIPKFGVKKS
ncbi:hypothetical protein GF366_01320 [Candidatus Peregrinibacteria bacterium]|nr:hypothetical protein [Candidatus Peregrinibacteria bacterium]